MCGITGLIDFTEDSGIRMSELAILQKTLKHRGPDGKGEFLDPHVGLAMRRLSIIDVEGGKQPLTNEKTDILAVGNGEIYNYPELQSTLKKRGHRFQTGSDIETAIHAYEEYGSKFPRYLRGMFALAIYDIPKAKVLLVRDRMGEKPLYYYRSQDRLVFSSELKSILKTRNIDKSLDYDALDRYFRFYYIPEPATAFKNIKKLPAGYLMEISVKNVDTTLRPYWEAATIKSTKTSNPVKQIRSFFSESCELTLRSDVPVGITLSGGIDSGSILSFSAPKYQDQMKAFSIGYQGSPPSDERPMAKKLAQQFKVEFFEDEISTAEAVQDFPQLVWSQDDPIADIAGYAAYRVYKLARKNNVKVLLGGIGGDELFWGYPSSVEAAKKNIDRYANKRLFNLFKSPQYLFNNPNPDTTATLITPIYSKDFRSKLSVNYRHLIDYQGDRSPVDIARHTIDLVRDIWLQSDVIPLNDRLSMSSSVELRSPFLDYKLVEYVLSSKTITESFRLEQKYWLKQAMKGILPDEVLQRPKKGFTPPVAEWIQAISKKYVHLLKNGFLMQYFILDSKIINNLSSLFTILPTYSVYQILLLEIWGREYVLGQNYKDFI